MANKENKFMAGQPKVNNPKSPVKSKKANVRKNPPKPKNHVQSMKQQGKNLKAPEAQTNGRAGMC